jgi:hypothetical protein
MSMVRRHPLIAFFVLAYAFSWWPWPLYALGLSPGAIVGFGPFLAAVVVLALTGGKAGVMILPRRMVCSRWRSPLVRRRSTSRWALGLPRPRNSGPGLASSPPTSSCS